MKKLLVMLLVSALSLSMLAGCGANGEDPDSGRENHEVSADAENDEDKQQDAEDSNADNADDEDDAEAESTEAAEGGIRENGQLPEDVEELTEEEVYYHMGVVFEAFRTLDTQTLATYTDDESLLEHLDAVREDAEALDFWNKIVGEMVYFADSDILMAKSSGYIYGNWYTQAWKEGKELVDEVAELSKEEALALYDQYFAEAPYVCGQIIDELDPVIEDGYLICEMDGILESVWYAELSEIWGIFDPIDYAVLLMGAEDCFGLGYDYLAEDMPAYETVLSMNLNDIYTVVEEQIPEEKKDGLYYEYYQKYVVPEENRAIMQQAIDENVQAYRTLYSVWVMEKADVETDYPMSYATEETRSQLKNYNVVNCYHIRRFPTDFGNDFTVFYEVAEKLIASGALPQ